MKAAVHEARLPGPSPGSRFEDACATFVRDTFGALGRRMQDISDLPLDLAI